MVKEPMSGAAWENNLNRSISLIREKKKFFFSANLDPDSVGSMIALALYLQKMGKRVYILLADPLRENLQFLEDIIKYNQIRIIDEEKAIPLLKDKIEALVFFDTANPKLAPFFSAITTHFLDRDLPVIEIDHHFGADSIELTQGGIKLFRKANATAEIIAELLKSMAMSQPDSPNPFRQRNILLCLMTGMLTDTVGGRHIPFQKEYSHWMELMTENLAMETWEQKEGSDNKNFSNPEEILEYLDQLSHQQEVCVDFMAETIVQENGVGWLNFLDSNYEKYKSVCRPFESDWFAGVREALLSIVPEKEGKAGLLCFQGKNAEEQKCFFIKIRRAINYSGIDLREVEPFIKDLFGENLYMGGGGHAGAVSFRVHVHEENDFVERVNKILQFLREHSNGS